MVSIMDRPGVDLRRHDEYREAAELLDHLTRERAEAWDEYVATIQEHGRGRPAPRERDAQPRQTSRFRRAVDRLLAGDFALLDEPAGDEPESAPEPSHLQRVEQRLALLDAAREEQRRELRRLRPAASALVCSEIGDRHRALVERTRRAVLEAIAMVGELEDHLEALRRADVAWQAHLPGAKPPDELLAARKALANPAVQSGIARWLREMEG